MLKILQARLQEYVNRELPDIQAGFRKGRGTRDQIANICWIIKKAKSKKNICFCSLDYARAFDCVDHNKLENSERDGNTRPPDLLLEKSVCSSGSNSQNCTWKQTGSKEEKEYIKVEYCHPTYFIYMQST